MAEFVFLQRWGSDKVIAVNPEHVAVLTPTSNSPPATKVIVGDNIYVVVGDVVDVVAKLYNAD